MRRVMSGLLAALLLLSLGAVSYVPVMRADDFTIWCWDDPIVKVNNDTYQIKLGVEGKKKEVHDTVTAQVKILVPTGTDVRVLAENGASFPLAPTQVLYGGPAGTMTVTVTFTSSAGTKNAAVQVKRGNQVAQGIGSAPGTVTASIPLN